MAEAPGASLGRGNDKNIQIPPYHLFDFFLLKLRIFFRRRNDQTIALFAKCAGSAFCYLSEEWMYKIRHNQAHQIALSRNERARGPVRLILELFDSREDAIPRLGTDVLMIT